MRVPTLSPVGKETASFQVDTRALPLMASRAAGPGLSALHGGGIPLPWLVSSPLLSATAVGIYKALDLWWGQLGGGEWEKQRGRHSKSEPEITFPSV